MSDLIRFAADSMALTQVGGKAASLNELYDFTIPEWFVITPAAFHQSNCEPTDPATWELSDELQAELQISLDQLSSGDDHFAVRSSAVDEDGHGFSFAGQLESYLGVAQKDVADKIVAVWKSAFSDRIRAYRTEHHLGHCTPPAVIVQRMIKADSAGVCFAVDPISGNWNHALVSSVWGLGNTLVDGTVDADTWQIDRTGKIVQAQMGHKSAGCYYKDGAAYQEMHDDAKAKAPSLSNTQTTEVAALARLCSKRKGVPQDIEWAYEKGKLYLLQSRPITSLGQVPDPEGNINIWDNSNIAESYGGVTTPLTYSFARSIYEAVYRQFCKIMGVPNPIIEANEETYRGLLGLMNGRMYYNLMNWYKLLACFPGFSINRGFMEQMMGVQKELGEELMSLLPRTKASSRVKNIFFLSKAITGMLVSHFRISTQIDHFYKRLNKALAKPEIPLADQRPDELVASYRELENKLLLKWDAPLVNDFFAMIFFGLLSKICKSWCADENGTLQNDLVGGSGQVISAEPAKKVSALADMISDDRAAIELFRSGSVSAIMAYIKRHQKMNQQYRLYLDKFGDRCIDELKLESITLHDNPLPLLRAIGHFAGHNKKVAPDQAADARMDAQRRAAESLNAKPIKRIIFSFILKHARARVEDRENLRFERTRLFGRVRQIMLELGKRFACLGVLDHHKEIFYLEKDEILLFVEGFASCPDMRGIARVRKRHFKQYATMKPIADRFQTKGMVFVANDFNISDGEQDTQHQGGDVRQGIGCCPGVVRGTVRVVRDPNGVELQAGSILVAERTDPGWIMLFPAASGLLVEKGSLLSHSAIVARELGLPAVVSIPGVTNWLKDGDKVEFDGSTGKVRVLNEAD